jgi:hypothetical protein
MVEPQSRLPPRAVHDTSMQARMAGRMTLTRDLQQLRRAQGHFAGHDRQLIDLGEIAYAPQQPVGNPRRPA